MIKVLVGGCFDLIHPGHINFLRSAKSLGDNLIVVLAHNKTVKRKKGHLIFDISERASILSSIKYVDKVVYGDEKNFFKVVEREEPDIIALGYDQDDLWIRQALAEKRFKCKIIRIEKFGNYSTKNIIKKLKLWI